MAGIGFGGWLPARRRASEQWDRGRATAGWAGGLRDERPALGYATGGQRMRERDAAAGASLPDAAAGAWLRRNPAPALGPSKPRSAPPQDLDVEESIGSSATPPTKNKKKRRGETRAAAAWRSYALGPWTRGFFFGRWWLFTEDGRPDWRLASLRLPAPHYGAFLSLSPPAEATAPPPIDPSFAFLRARLALSDGEDIFLLDSRNGLLLFGRKGHRSDTWDSGFVVCNPATRQWAPVPACRWQGRSPPANDKLAQAYLGFDPAVSSHFHLLLVWEDVAVLAYSSEAGAWSHGRGAWSGRSRRWSVNTMLDNKACAFVNRMFYLVLFGGRGIAEVDVAGNTRRIIPVPPPAQPGYHSYVFFVGHSQRRLHCIAEESPQELEPPVGISIWVLEVEGNAPWRLKRRTSYLQLFGTAAPCEASDDYSVIAMDPDFNKVFLAFFEKTDEDSEGFVEFLKLIVANGGEIPDPQLVAHNRDNNRDMGHVKVMAYDFDSHTARLLYTFRILINGLFSALQQTFPYVPYLSELFLGVVGAHK